ncbi:mucin-19-like isoform X2 [Dermacentor albipictus]|uniref:mucin-19-like isoform X2 n=1 Tax=Dermacentor albipictus TaxID=60249 RepID=UPI0038FC34F2
MKLPQPLQETYTGRLRKLIFANLPLLLLIIGCLPLFLLLVPTASSLSSHSAQLTPLSDADEFDKPASSGAANAASKTTRAPAAAAAENDEVEAAAEAATKADVQHAPQSSERRHRHVTKRKPARRTDVATRPEKRRHTTRRRHRATERNPTTRRHRTTQEEEEEEREKEMLAATPKRHRGSPADEKLAKPESELGRKQVASRTQGPLQELTGPKGRRLVRRVVRKRRKTTPLVGNASSAVSASPMLLGTTTVNADNDLEDRKLDEAQELAERLWGIIAETVTTHSGRIGMASRTSAAYTLPRRSSHVYSQATEAVSDIEGRRRLEVLAPNFGGNSAATYGLPTNETCVNPSHCRAPSYNNGSGSRRAPPDNVETEEPRTFQHPAELTRDSTPPRRTQGKAWTQNRPPKTTVMSSGALDLLDWLFGLGVNNRLSNTESARKEFRTESSSSLAAKTSDDWSTHSSRFSTTGAGPSLAAKSHELTSKSFKNRSYKMSDRIIGVETAATSSSHKIATNSELETATFRKILNRSDASSLSSTSSPSQTPVEPFSDMSRGLRTGKVSEGTVPLSYLPPNEPLATASREIQPNGNKFSASVGKPLQFSTESDAGGGNADPSLKALILADEDSSEDDYDDGYEEDEKNNDDNDEQDALIKKGLLPTFGRRQGLSGPERRNYSDNQTRTPFSASDKNLVSRSHSVSATERESKEPSWNFGGATQKHGADVGSEDGGHRHSTVRGISGRIRNLRLNPPAPNGVSGRSAAPGQAMTENFMDGRTAVASSLSDSDELPTTSFAEERMDSPTKWSGVRDAEARGSPVRTAATEGHTPSHEPSGEVPRLIYNSESHNLTEPTKAAAPTKASGNTASVNATTSSEQGGIASGGAVSRNHTGSTVNLRSIPPLSHLGEVPNAPVVPEVLKTELSKELTTRASTRRRLRLETTPHNSAPDVLELTSSTGTVSSKAQGHTLPQKLHIMCSIGATYPGPYPVELCDKIMIKDAVSFDQVRIKFTVRSYDAFLALKAQQIKRPSFKIVGLMTWRNIEQFRLLNPSSDAFVGKVERLLLRINLDGLCMDLAGVSRGNIMAYRHILRDMRVRLMDTKFLCSLFDYNVLYKASFQDLLSLLRVFNTTVIYQSVQSISNMETSVPNALRHLTRRKYSLTAALELAMEIRGMSRHRGVCWTLTPWGMEYRLLLPNEATGVGVLARFVRTAVSGSDLCTTYRRLPRTYDNMTASWYFVNNTKWVAYDDRNSLEQKIPQLLAAYAPDCVYVEDVQRDDPRGVCDRPFPLVSSLQGMLAEALKYTTHLAGSSTTTTNFALVGDRRGEVVLARHGRVSRT